MIESTLAARNGRQWSRPVLQVLLGGVTAAMLIVLQVVFTDGSLLAMLVLSCIVNFPITLLVLIAVVLGIPMLSGKPLRHSAFVAGKLFASLLLGFLLSLPACRIANQVAADSGLSRLVISDGALRRTFSRHSDSFLAFESGWNSALSEDDARSITDKLCSSIHCSSPAYWDSIGGSVYFRFAESRPFMEHLEKGIALNPTQANRQDLPASVDCRPLEGRWLIYVDGSTEPGAWDVR